MDDAWKNYTMIILTAAVLASLGLNAMPEANNYCTALQTKAYCFSLSSTNKTCYTLPANTGGKQCLTLPYWQKIPPAPLVPAPLPEAGCPSVNVVAYTDNGKYFCDGIGPSA